MHDYANLCHQKSAFYAIQPWKLYTIEVYTNMHDLFQLTLWWISSTNMKFLYVFASLDLSKFWGSCVCGDRDGPRWGASLGSKFFIFYFYCIFYFCSCALFQNLRLPFSPINLTSLTQITTIQLKKLIKTI